MSELNQFITSGGTEYNTVSVSTHSTLSASSSVTISINSDQRVLLTRFVADAGTTADSCTITSTSLSMSSFTCTSTSDNDGYWALSNDSSSVGDSLLFALGEDVTLTNGDVADDVKYAYRILEEV